MMNLVTVKAAKQSPITGWIEFTITADLGDGAQDYPYTYNPAENEGMNPEVTAWLMANPAFPIAEADPESPPSTDPADYPLSMRQLRLGLFMNGYAVDFLQSVISAIPDATERGMAQIWYEETSVVEWAHPMTQSLMSAAGISTADATAMWLQAKDLAA